MKLVVPFTLLIGTLFLQSCFARSKFHPASLEGDIVSWLDAKRAEEACRVKTTLGFCCKFPFTYKGEEYDSCTKAGHGIPWCSLTSDFDQDKKWGECAEENKAPMEPECRVKTTLGFCCKFPFTYKGEKFDSCTKAGHGIPWCSLTSDFDQDGQWGECEEENKAPMEPECRVKTTLGFCCKFPFTYKGEKYDSCTEAGHGIPWCSLTSDFDKDRKWGLCP